MRSISILLLSLLPLALADSNYCPGGTWVDQNGGCHFGGRPEGEPVGWIDRNGRRILPQIWPGNHPNTENGGLFPAGTNTVTYTLPDGTRVILPADKRYSRASNPGVFFDARWQDTRDIQPLRDNGGQAIPYLNGVNWGFAKRMRLVHGVLSSLAFVLLFPVGAMIVNLGPGMLGVGGHVVVQIFGWLFYLVGAAAGLWIASVIRWQGFSFFRNYHAVIGLILFILLFIQPILGILHHLSFRRNNRRGFFSTLHVWVGRLIILLGIINGGLGLLIAGNATKGQIVAYALVSALMFVAWIASSLLGCLKRHRRDVPRRPKGRKMDVEGNPVMSRPTGPGRGQYR